MVQKEEQKKMKRKPRLTLQYLLKNDLPVWVRNRTGDPGVSKEPGLVVFQAGSKDYIGPVTIPPGDDPVCITDQVDPESLRSCRDLFNLIRGGALELLDPEKAEEYYVVNDQRKQIMSDKIDRYMRIEPLEPKKRTGPWESHKNELYKNAGEDVPGGTINPKIGSICQKAKHQAISEREALESLMEQSKVFTPEDFQYIVSNGIYTSVRKWAKEQLFKKQTEDIDIVDAMDD